MFLVMQGKLDLFISTPCTKKKLRHMARLGLQVKRRLGFYDF